MRGDDHNLNVVAQQSFTHDDPHRVTTVGPPTLGPVLLAERDGGIWLIGRAMREAIPLRL